jgi:hypothetical protein
MVCQEGIIVVIDSIVVNDLIKPFSVIPVLQLQFMQIPESHIYNTISMRFPQKRGQDLAFRCRSSWNDKELI